MAGTAVRERCLEVIGDLPIPRPFDLERFRLALARQRGRALRLIPADGATDGLWIATATTDCIYYPQDANQLRQLHVIARELGHMLLEHHGAPAATSQIARLVLPSIDPALVISTLGGVVYSPAQQREADQFAYLLLDHMETEPAGSHLSRAGRIAPIPSRPDRTYAVD